MSDFKDKGMKDKRQEPAPRRNMYVVEGRAKYAVDTVRFERNAQKKTKKRYSDGGMVLGLALLSLIVYLAGHIYTFFSHEKIPETVVVFGSIEPVHVFSGVIVRDEIVYRSPAAGLVVYYKSDHEKIRAGDAGCNVQDEQAVQKYAETLSGIENSMLNTQQNRTRSQTAENEIKDLNNQIVKAVDSISMSVSALDISAVYSVSSKIGQLISQRNQLLLSDSRGSVKTLSQELGIYQSMLGNAINDVNITASGIINYTTDGLEESLTPVRLKELSKEETEQDSDYGELYTPSYVAKGDPVFKIIQSNEWYVVSYLPLDQTDGWQPETSKTIYADNGEGVYEQLETIIHSMTRIDDEMYVVFRCNKNVIDYLNRRGVRFKIKKGLTEGLKIPNSAIVDKTVFKIPLECVMDNDEKGTKFVMRYNSDTGAYENVTITVFSSDEMYAGVISVYNNVRIGDKMLVPDKGEQREIYLIESVKGVYVTNTGSATFKRIILSGDVYENVLYTIINPALNPYVKVQDRIVSDARNVEEKQMIY